MQARATLKAAGVLPYAGSKPVSYSGRQNGSGPRLRRH